jgi:hypothetical protein
MTPAEKEAVAARYLAYMKELPAAELQRLLDLHMGAPLANTVRLFAESVIEEAAEQEREAVNVVAAAVTIGYLLRMNEELEAYGLRHVN